MRTETLRIERPRVDESNKRMNRTGLDQIDYGVCDDEFVDEKVRSNLRGGDRSVTSGKGSSFSWIGRMNKTIVGENGNKYFCNCVDRISRDGSVVLWSLVATVLVWLVLCGALWFLFFICMFRCGSLWFCVGPGERLRFLVLLLLEAFTQADTVLGASCSLWFVVVLCGSW